MGSLALIDSVNYDDKGNVTITGHDFNMNIVKNIIIKCKC
jgi:hypothetical protein